jgi:phosphatidylserine/phosphatidylglycerophosphate/cardiolipin synthase-like enzyme/uncharacterized membrane protein YdjX (TVP38/TMEM64 family)
MPSDILRPNRNVWRIEHAHRAAVLSDGAAFFRAVRESFIQARRSIFVLGWDIDSRTRLIGESEPDDGYPALLSDFLCELVSRRPELRINLLLWDYSILYTNEREFSPRLSLQWSTPEQITLCMDNTVPFGCSQHQKIIVVDDAVAFSGGLDLTIRRWDTSDHSAANSMRVDPAGEDYPPFHDVQMVVDGATALSLAEIARERWSCAYEGGQDPSRPARDPANGPPHDPWPDSAIPDFTDVDVAIARTQPACEGQAEIREVETLFLDAIDAAERTIYIENQYLTVTAIAKRLARRLRQKPKLEVLIVAPHAHESWVEAHTMRNGRIRFLKLLRKRDKDRIRVVYPEVDGGDRKIQTMIHSKVMVVDDRFLRVGSANMNNRSMGADTECDLVIEAKNKKERDAIATVRNRLIGEHCGCSTDQVAKTLQRTGSLLATTDTLCSNGHRLRSVDDGKPDRGVLAGYLEDIADPKRPLQFSSLWQGLWRRMGLQGGPLAIAGLILLAITLTLAWHYTPLADYASLDAVREQLASIADKPWAPVLVLGAFVLGGLVAFPVIVLILATTVAFGAWPGFAYALLGALASALVTYLIGAWWGQDALRALLGRRLDRVREAIARQGVVAVAVIRLVPVAPFTVVNLIAGASAIKLTDYLIGTVIGLLPGMIVMTALGSQIVNLLSNPSATDVALLALAVAVWIGISFAIQAMATKLRSRTS